MIKDEQMIELGFKKMPTFRKKETGVSKYSWMLYNAFELTIEKHMHPDIGDEFFMPTLRISSCFWSFRDIETLKEVLTVLNLIKNK